MKENSQADEIKKINLYKTKENKSNKVWKRNKQRC